MAYNQIYLQRGVGTGRDLSLLEYTPSYSLQDAWECGAPLPHNSIVILSVTKNLYK